MPEWWITAGPWAWSAAAVGGALVFLLLVKKVLIRRLERLAAATENDLDDRLVDFFRHFVGVIVVFATFLVILRIHHIRITALLAGAGIAGIAVGLAAKETLSDILAGVFLIADRPMRVGDRVKIERPGRDWGGWGDVVDVGLRRTMIRNTDGVIVNYPNNVLANSVITNFSYEDAPVRVRVRFQVGYDADLARARETAERAIARSEGVLPDTAQVVVRAMWDTTAGHLQSGILMEGRYRIADVRDRTRIRSGVIENLLHDLREAGVPLALPRVSLGR